jgi:HIRAN domain
MSRHFSTMLKGVTHENSDGGSRQEIIARCSVGEELSLVPEPDNPFDAGAVKVSRLNGEVIGYLPKGNQVAHLMAGGTGFRTSIERIFHMGRDGSLCAELSVEVFDGSPSDARQAKSANSKNKNIGIGCVTVIIGIFVLGLLIHFL